MFGSYCSEQRKRRKLKHPDIQLPAKQIFVDRTIYCFHEAEQISQTQNVESEQNVTLLLCN